LAVEQRLAGHAKRLDDLESRFTSLSGRQTAIHVALRDQLGELEARIAELQSAVEYVDQRNVRLLRQLTEDIAERTQEIAQHASRGT
jgi:Arc/MetJ family transcription regulator